MYATCIFCNGALGRNDALEHFSVGQRLAFDPAKGRLWAVCPRCERWNLTPLETRWEAIEEAERAYRGMKLRVSTDNIGLARVPGGLELVRVGAPLVPEFAAWRYGDQFGRRRRKHLILAGAGIAAAGAVSLVPTLAGLASVSTAVTLASMSWNGSLLFRSRRSNTRTRAIVRVDSGRAIQLTADNIQSAALLGAVEPGGTLRLGVPHGRSLPVPTATRP